MPQPTCFVVSHTHWDREWYQPFQEFRIRLVGLMDRLLDLFAADSDYRYFMLDGQTIVLEDYLAVRPEREAEVCQQVQAGRLLVGPWYVLPDEFLVHPESLIRNLLLGHWVARRFGSPMPVGYIPDTFGHISQLPQILAGFGIDSAVLWRGLPDLPTEFHWQAPDGTTVLAINIRDGYGNIAWAPGDADGFTAVVRRAVARLAPHATFDGFLLMDGTDHLEARPDLPALIAAANARLSPEEGRLVHASLPQYVAALKTAAPPLQTIGGEFRSPERTSIIPGVLSARMWIKQRNRACEMLLTHWAEPFSAIAGWLDATPPDGLTAASCRDLIRHAWRLLLQNHPHDSICGCSVDQVHEEMRCRFDQVEQIGEEIVRQSLQAIVGRVNTAAVANLASQSASPLSLRAPQGRSNPQCSEGIASGQKARLAMTVSGNLQPAPAIPIVVFNPTAAPRDDLVRVRVQIPPRWAGYELVDAEGQTVPCQELQQEAMDFSLLGINREELLDRVVMEHPERIGGQGIIGLSYRQEGGQPIVSITLGAHAHPGRAQVADALAEVRARLTAAGVSAPQIEVALALLTELAFVARDVPGCGYATYVLRPSSKGATPAVARNQPIGATLAVAQGEGKPRPYIENVCFHLEADPDDGTLTVHDQRTGVVYRGLNRFVDEADRGDEYNHCPIERGLIVDRPAWQPLIRVIENGPVRQTVEIKLHYRVPASLDETRHGRAGEWLDLPITTRVSLIDGVPRLDFETTVDNRARDHRLRVCFPTPLQADVFRTETPFDVVERPLDLPHDTADWPEQPAPTHPQLTFSDLSDGRRGLLLINRGLPEVEARREGEGTTLLLTLLRCVGWLSRDDMPVRQGPAGPGLPTPGAQCPGLHTFHYALVPHDGQWLAALPQAHAFQAPLRAVAGELHQGTLPARHSFISVTPPAVVVSALKAAEDGEGLVVHFWNTAAEPRQASIRLALPFQSVFRANLNEQPIEALTPDSDGTFHLSLRPRQVATVYVRNKT